MINSLYLHNFRNIEEVSLEFGPKINILYGLNAQGKTNILEAIALLSTGRSFRTQQLSELIRDGSSFFFLEANFSLENISQTLRISYDGQNKKLIHNTSTYHSFQPLLGLLPSVFFTPQDSDLIAGPPSLRRRFLDLHLVQSDPLYVHHLLRFWRALKQRNALLRTKSFDAIECWEQEIVLSSSYLQQKRREFLLELNTLLLLSPLKKETIKIVYQPSPEKNYLDHLLKNRKREALTGFTLCGPHRDDFTLFLSEKPARPYASEGQKRSTSAALRLAEWQRLQIQTETFPLFGIDDFELHLDQERQQLLRNALQELGQVFITTPEEPRLWEGAERFFINGGKISQRSCSPLESSKASSLDLPFF